MRCCSADPWARDQADELGGLLEWEDIRKLEDVYNNPTQAAIRRLENTINREMMHEVGRAIRNRFLLCFRAGPSLQLITCSLPPRYVQNKVAVHVLQQLHENLDSITCKCQLTGNALVLTRIVLAQCVRLLFPFLSCQSRPLHASGSRRLRCHMVTSWRCAFS